MATWADEGVKVTGASGDVDRDEDRTTRAEATFAWLTLFFAVWLMGAIVAAVRAAVQALEPSAFEQAIDAFELGLAVLAVACLGVLLRAVRNGRPWRRAFPRGYGVLGAGLAVLAVGWVADQGWRLGVADPQGIEGLLAPTRVLLVVGLVLVACGPLRAASLATDAHVPRWAAVLSACLVLVAILLPGGFAPALDPWLERPPTFFGGELWLMDSDGSHQERLITSTDRDGPFTATFSPDGKRIAYAVRHLGERSPFDDEADVWVADADGTHLQPLVQGPTFQWLPHWSPDGIWIVFTDEPPGGPWMASGPDVVGGPGLIGPGYISGAPAQLRQFAHIWRVRADGTGSPEQITNVEADDRAATYSPDGTKLAFDSTRDSDGKTRVWIMDADGSNVHRLSGGADDWGATWSPDGASIAYYSWSGVKEPGSSQIWIHAADGTAAPRQLTFGSEAVNSPSWSPDGSRIAFTVVGDDRSSVWSIGVDSSHPANLTNDARASGDLISGGGAWGKDGRIVFTHGEDPPAIASGYVREDLAVAATLLTAVLVALVAVITVRTRPPFGAFATILGISTAALAVISGEWRFVPAAIAMGLVVDLLVRISPERWKAIAAGGGSAAGIVVGASLTAAVTSGIAWSPTLISGVVVLGALLGALLGELVGRARSTGAAA
jgi:TolB protein